MGVAVSVSLRLLLLRVSVLRVSAILASVNLVAYAARDHRRGLRHPSGGDLLRLRVRRHGRRARRCQPVRGGLPAAPSEKKKDGRLTLSRFRKMKGMGESSAPEPATGEAVPEDASVAAPALI